MGFVALILSLVGLMLNARKDIRCWPVWMISNGFWIGHALVQADPSVLLLNLLFLVFNAYGWRSWKN